MELLPLKSRNIAPQLIKLGEKPTLPESKEQGDRLDLSVDAREKINDYSWLKVHVNKSQTRDVDLDHLRQKAQTGFYNSPEILEKTAGSVLDTLA